MKDNVAERKSKAFAIRAIKLYRYLVDEKKEYVLSKQLLRSGTSIGANVREAERGQSRADFYAKCGIALKEADETAYWLELLHESGILSDVEFSAIYPDCEELIRLLVAITKSQKHQPLSSVSRNSSLLTPNSSL